MKNASNLNNVSSSETESPATCETENLLHLKIPEVANLAEEMVPTPAAAATITTLVAARPVQMADTSELERLIASEALTRLRFFQSFDYSASLFFRGEPTEYYAALFHEGVLWRAFCTEHLDAAEGAFRHVQDQVVRMTDGEIRRVHLLADRQRLAAAIEQTEAHAEQLRGDIDRDTTQTQLISTKQHELRKELAQLEAQRVSARAQLNRASRLVHGLRLTNNESIRHVHSRRDDSVKK